MLRADPDFVAGPTPAAHRVYVWTVNEPGTSSSSIGLGVDTVITDRPAAVGEQLRRTGHRPTPA